MGWKPEWRPGFDRAAETLNLDLHMEDLAVANLSSFTCVLPVDIKDHNLIDLRRAEGISICAISCPAGPGALCADKLALNRKLIELGYGDHIPALLSGWNTDPLQLPIVLKPRWGGWGAGIQIITTSEQLEPHRAALAQSQSFLQSLVQGADEYAVHLLLKDGRLLYGAAIHHQMSAPNLVKGQSNSPKRSLWCPEVPFVKLWLLMLHDIGLTDGTVCIDFRMRGTMPMVFEINPRMGGSLSGRPLDYLRTYLRHAGP